MKKKLEQFNEYFKTPNHIVFWVWNFCLIWIICYQYWLIDSDFLYPYWKGADIAGDIFYKISLSIIAAGIFYFINVFVPRYFQKNKMEEQLIPHLNHIDELSSKIIREINKDGTDVKYTLDSFFESLTTNNDGVKKDFVDSYNNYDKGLILEKIITFQKEHYNTILINYNDLLPKDTVVELSEFCNLYFKSLGISFKSDEEFSRSQWFLLFHQVLFLSKKLRGVIKIKKNETIQ